MKQKKSIKMHLLGKSYKFGDIDVLKIVKLKEKSGTINLPIARKQGSIIERCIDKNGKPSITHYEVLEEFEDYSLVKCKLETGRTHQIRVHMAAIGHPLLRRRTIWKSF